MAQAPASEAVRKQQGRPAASEPPLKPKKDVLASRRSRFAKGSTSVDPMELLTSPSRGVDSVVTPAMIGLHETVSAGKATLSDANVQNKYRAYLSAKIQEHSIQYPPCSTLLKPPCTLALAGMPTPLREMSASAKQKAQRDSLQNVLLLVRKLREGIVSANRLDAMAVDVCGNRGQLAAAASRLVETMYPLQTSGDSAAPAHSMTQDLAALFHADSAPALAHLADRRARRALFSAIWVLEPLYSQQPHCVPSYLDRRAYVLGTDHGEDTRLLSYMAFSHAVFQAWRRGEGYRLGRLLQGDAFPSLAHDLAGGEQGAHFWLRMMAMALVPHARSEAQHILRAAFLRIPVRPEFASMVKQDAQFAYTDHTGPAPKNAADIQWLERVLLLDVPFSGGNGQPSRLPNPATLQSALVLAGLANQFGITPWLAACTELRARLVEGDMACALRLRP